MYLFEKLFVLRKYKVNTKSDGKYTKYQQGIKIAYHADDVDARVVINYV
jgi:hypothetical protein